MSFNSFDFNLSDEESFDSDVIQQSFDTDVTLQESFDSAFIQQSFDTELIQDKQNSSTDDTEELLTPNISINGDPMEEADVYTGEDVEMDLSDSDEDALLLAMEIEKNNFELSDTDSESESSDMILYEEGVIVCVRPHESEEEEFWLAMTLDDVKTNQEMTEVNWLENTKNKFYLSRNFDKIPVDSIIFQVEIEKKRKNYILTKKLKQKILDMMEQSDVKLDEDADKKESPKKKSDKKRKRKSGEKSRKKRKRESDETEERGTKKRKYMPISKKLKLKDNEGQYPLMAKDPYFSMTNKNINSEFGADMVMRSKEGIRAILTKNDQLLDAFLLADNINSNIERSADMHETCLTLAVSSSDISSVKKILDSLKKYFDAPNYLVPTIYRPISMAEIPEELANAKREGILSLSKDVGYISAEENVMQSLVLGDSTVDIFELSLSYYPEIGNLQLRKFARRGNFEMCKAILNRKSLEANDLLNALLDENLKSTQEMSTKTSLIRKRVEDRIAPIHLASIIPNAKFAEILIESLPASLQCNDSHNWKPIHYAATCTGTGPIELILQTKKSSYKDLTKDDETILMISSMMGRSNNTRIILEYNENKPSKKRKYKTKFLNSRDSKGWNALHHAANSGSLEIVEALIEYGIDLDTLDYGYNYSPMHVACAKGHYTIVETLINTLEVDVNQVDKFGRSPIFMAVINGHTNIVTLLLQNGAFIFEDSSGNSLLHYSVGYGWLEMTKYLVKFVKINVNSLNKEKYTPLHFAVLKSHESCARYLLKLNASPNVPNAELSTPLALICMGHPVSESKALVDTLFETENLELNLPDVNGYSPIHHIASSDIEDKTQMDVLLSIGKKLLEHGVRPDEASDTGLTPFSLALQSFNIPLMQLFLSHGADVSSPIGEKSINILHQMALQEDFISNLANYSKFIQFIRSCDDSLSLPVQLDEDGYTPLHRFLIKYLEISNSHDDSSRKQFEEFIMMYIDLFRVDLNLPTSLKKSFRSFVLNREKSLYLEVVQPSLMEISDEMDIDESSEEKVDLVIPTDAFGEPLNRDQRILRRTETLQKKELIRHQSKVKTVKLLEKKSSISETSENQPRYAEYPGFSAIHFLSLTQSEFLAFILDNYNIEINKKAISGDTALHIALRESNILAVSLLLQHNADVNTLNEKLQSPVLLATRSSNPMLLLELLEKHSPNCDDHDERGNTPLLFAVKSGNLELVSKLLSMGSNPNSHDSEKNTPLYYAVQSENVEMIQILIDNGCNPNIECSLPPIILALRGRNTNIIQMLILAGVDPNVTDVNEQTPLHMAVRLRNLDAVKLLITSNADVNAKDNKLRTPLHIGMNQSSSSFDSYSPIEEYLIASGSDVDSIDSKGRSPMHYLFVDLDDVLMQKQYYRDPIRSLRLLLTANADIHIVDYYKKSVLHYAAQCGALISSYLLIDQGIDIELKDQDNNTALGVSINANYPEFGIKLIRSGANIDITVHQVIREVIPGGEIRAVSESECSLFRKSIEKDWQGLSYLVLDEGYNEFNAIVDCISLSKISSALSIIESLKDKSILKHETSQGYNLLHELSRSEHPFSLNVVNFAQQLLDLGLTIHHNNKERLSPLHLAAKNKHLELVKFFLQHGVDIDSRDANGDTPISFALKNTNSDDPNFISVLDYLLEQGATFPSRSATITNAIENRNFDLANTLIGKTK